jgi:hypothetical protein
MTGLTPEEESQRYIEGLLRPSTGRQLPRRSSPLANAWVAPNHRYDAHTGLVSPVTPPAVSP